MTDIIFSTNGEESFRIPSNKLEIPDSGYLRNPGAVCPKTPLHIREMTEIEKTEGEIKVLQAKLELLKEMENHKSPAEEAYKRFFGCYPDTGVSWNSDKENSWYFFQVGYNASQKDCKVEEEPEQATLYDIVRHTLEYDCAYTDEIVDSVRCWLPNEMEHDEDLNGYRAGWNDCINTLNKKLR